MITNTAKTGKLTPALARLDLDIMAGCRIRIGSKLAGGWNPVGEYQLFSPDGHFLSAIQRGVARRYLALNEAALSAEKGMHR